MAYTMNSPYKDVPAMPSKSYLEGILNGCRQNGIEIASILEAVWLTQRELPEKGIPRKTAHPKKRRRTINLTCPRGVEDFPQICGGFFYFI